MSKRSAFYPDYMLDRFAECGIRMRLKETLKPDEKIIQKGFLFYVVKKGKIEMFYDKLFKIGRR
jgi:hypothetical protein